MDLENSRLYDLEIKDLNGDEIIRVTKHGWELLNEYPHLKVGQVVNGWKSFLVTAFGN